MPFCSLLCRHAIINGVVNHEKSGFKSGKGFIMPLRHIFAVLECHHRGGYIGREKAHHFSMDVLELVRTGHTIFVLEETVGLIKPAVSLKKLSLPSSFIDRGLQRSPAFPRCRHRLQLWLWLWLLLVKRVGRGRERGRGRQPEVQDDAALRAPTRHKGRLLRRCTGDYTG